jgi:hypothetical protein
MGNALLLFNLSRPRRLIELNNLTQTASRNLAENTQMIVFPAHGNLQNATELLERGHRGYFNAPPDKRLNLPERNM